MTLQEIIKCRSCTELFPDDPKEAEKVYLSLIKRFHPDVCSDPLCGEASAVINNLYRRIKRSPSLKKFEADNCGCPLRFNYISRYAREDGIMYFSENNVYYQLDWSLNECVKNTISLENGIDINIARQAESFLPHIINFIPIDYKSGVFVDVKIKKGEFPLDKAFEFFGKNIDPRHCAWIISRLLGMCCFAELSGRVWNCLCTENMLINPAMHTLRIAGGWWFSSEKGKKISGVQHEIYENMPPSCRTDGIARPITDLECVKAVCRKIFPEDSPEPMLDFSESICMSNAFDEMEYWEETINKSFGGRYFTPMKLCFADIYSG